MLKILSLLLFLCAGSAHAVLDHECSVRASVTIHDLQTFRIKAQRKLSSEWFPVTKLSHEAVYSVSIKDEQQQEAGQAQVWTGTLMGSIEGDLIQAHAKVEIEGLSQQFSLFMSVQAPYAKTMVSLDKTDDWEFVLITEELRCQVKTL